VADPGGVGIATTKRSLIRGNELHADGSKYTGSGNCGHASVLRCTVKTTPTFNKRERVREIRNESFLQSVEKQARDQIIKTSASDDKLQLRGVGFLSPSVCILRMRLAPHWQLE